MLFSILIPVYNVEKYLKECLNSVISQDFDDYEIILVDDGSEDSSGKICDEFMEEYAVQCRVIHKKNEGLLAARRDAFGLARGEYCISLDSDDYLSEGALSHLSKIIHKYSPDFILYDLYTFNEKQETRNVNEKSHLLREDYLYSSTQILKDTLLDQSYINWSMGAKCIKTEIANLNFDYKRYYNINFGEDTIQSIVLYNRAENFVYTNRRIYNYRSGTGMTKELSIKYVEDFYEVSQFMRTECRGWNTNASTQIDVYFATVIYNFVVVNSENNVNTFVAVMRQLMSNEKFSHSLLYFVKNKNKMKIEFKMLVIYRFLLGRLYLPLYFLLRIYNTVFR